MADETPNNVTGTTRKKVSGSRIMSKKAANRIAAAKVYVAAMKKAGEEVPEWVQNMATQANSIKKAPSSRLVSKKDATRIAAAKAYVVAMKKAGEEVPESVQKLAQQDSWLIGSTTWTQARGGRDR